MKHVFVCGLIVAVALILADDFGPLPSRLHMFAFAVDGFFVVEGMQAQRCDTVLGNAGVPNTPPQIDLHEAILKRAAAAISHYAEIRDAYYRRMYGEAGPEPFRENMGKVAAMNEPQIPSDVGSCLRHGRELDRRLSGGWAAIEAMLLNSTVVNPQ